MHRRLSFILHPSAFILLLASLAFSDLPHTFKYHPDPKSPPQSVSVAGDFNGWSTSASPMTRTPAGDFTLTLVLPEGIHYYKFVLNGNQWTPDPRYSDKELEQDDNYGGHNSALLIGPDARKLPPPPPNAIRAEALHYDPAAANDFNVVTDSLLRVSLRTQSHDASAVSVLIKGADDKDFSEQPLSLASASLGLDRYAGVAEYHGLPAQYLFHLADGTANAYYAGGVLYSSLSAAAPHAYSCSSAPTFTTPDWAKNAVWYQIFPERFRNGDPSNDPPRTQRWTSNWFSTLPSEAPGDENFYKGKGNVWFRRYGGDIQGLKQSLPYLKKLGVTAIYLNPMFEAESMHKYDATDYRHIDDNFGVKGDLAKLHGETDDPATWQWTASDKLFLDFVAEAHKQGFKVILDGVFNHVGRDFWAFQDVLKYGKNSKYAEWFDVRDWNPPIKYIAWDTGGEPTDHGSLPVFKKDPKLGLVEGPRNHIFAVTKRWLAPDGDPGSGVDGWRLDVPGDIPHPFWADWRKLVKQTKPDAFIAGEIWDWAQPWLQGDQFDAVMNYRFADAAQQFFVNQKKAISPSDFASRLSQIVNAYPLQCSLVQMNLFDSHDTDRLASMFVNPDLPYDASNRIQDNGPNYSPAKPTDQQWARMEQAVTCQMTFLGAPMIYYGDEAGMWSPDDPSNRQPMLWQDLQPYDDPQLTFRPDLFAHYQRLIAIRDALKPLRWGYFRPIFSDDKTGLLAFSRTLGPDSVTVAINRSPRPQTITLPAAEPLLNWLDPASATLTTTPDARPTITSTISRHPLTPIDGKIKLTLQPYGSAILSPSSNPTSAIRNPQ